MNARAYDLGLAIGTLSTGAGAFGLAGWAWGLVVIGTQITLLTLAGAALSRGSRG